MEHPLDRSPDQEGGHGYPSVSPAHVHTLGCTLQAYAQYKCLPEAFLKSLGLSDIARHNAPAIRIPYWDSNGTELAVRIRTALEKLKGQGDRFHWRRGAKPCLYGLWRLQAGSSVVVVEGESDCHTLWYHAVNAVGIPGSQNWNEGRDAGHLAQYEKIYVVIEPDRGGEAMLKWVRTSSLRDRIHLVRLNGFKDPSALHIADPTSFRECWQVAVDNAIPWLVEEAKQSDAKRDEAWASCRDLALASDILSRFAAHLEQAGIVGVGREAKLLYLAVTSRRLSRPISVAVKGPSSGGKSHLVNAVLSYFPAEAYHALTAMSEHALAYSVESLVHRMLVLFEAEGMSGDKASYFIRSLLSEGCIRYETVEKTSQGLRPRFIEREGPTGLIVTTTREGLHPENETRMISITLADSPEQTRAIMRAIADEDRRDGVDRQPWLALQEYLAASDVQVSIPFAGALVELIPPLAVRLRRDTSLLLNLIRAHTILHQATRKRDERGRLIATLDDYSVVYDLVADLIGEGVQASVRTTIRETVAAVALIAEADGSATVSQVARYLNIHPSAASRRCTSAATYGYVRNEESRKRQTARYVLGDPLPDEQSVLPKPEVLATRLASEACCDETVCTFAGETEGIVPPPPSSAAVTGSRRVIL